MMEKLYKFIDELDKRVNNTIGIIDKEWISQFVKLNGNSPSGIPFGKGDILFGEQIGTQLHNFALKHLDTADFKKMLLKLEEDIPNAFNALKGPLKKLKKKHNYAPEFIINYYRGVQINDVKKSKKFDPNKSDFINKEYEDFLIVYEKIQNSGKRTFNEALAEFMDEDKANWLLVICEKINDSENNEELVFRDSKNLISIRIPEEIWNVLLLLKNNSVLEKIDDFIDENRKTIKLLPQKEHNNDDQTKNVISKIKNVEKELLNYRKIALTESNIINTGLINRLIEGFAKTIFGYDLSKEAIDDYTKDEILRFIQGICLWLSKTKSESMICFLSKVMMDIKRSGGGKDKKISSTLTCNGQSFVFCKKPLSEQDQIDYICSYFEVTDFIHRYISTFIKQQLSDERNPIVGPSDKKSMEMAFQNTSLAENLMKVNREFFDYGILAGVLRLAEVIRPAAVHEGTPLNITFVVGNQSIKNKLFTIKSEFLESSFDLSWVTSTKRPSLPEENEALLKARATILGNAMVLQNPEYALFVSCNELKQPVCTGLVQIDPPPVHGLTNPENFYELTRIDKNFFVVRVVGQRKIEVFQGGTKQAVWSDHKATWDEEDNWTEESIKKVLKLLFSYNKADDLDQYFNYLTNTALKISSSSRVGGAFIVCDDQEFGNVEFQAPEMTRVFPNLGEGGFDGEYKNTNNDLFDVAIQDGGTIIDISRLRHLGRRQFMPSMEQLSKEGKLMHTPFYYKNYVLPKKTWQDLDKLWYSDNLIKDRKTKKINENDVYKYDSKEFDNYLYEENNSKGAVCRKKYLVKIVAGKLKYINNPFYWQEWYNILSWGTRHMYSLGMSACLGKKVLVLVVSEDGSINLFYNGIGLKPDSSLTRVCENFLKMEG